MKYTLVLFILLLVSCNEDDTDYYKCNDQSKKLMYDFTLTCIDKGSSKLTNTGDGYYSDYYKKVVGTCSYNSKKMFCMEPLKYKKEEKD